MKKAMNFEELYVALEGKTERQEVEEILKRATVVALKRYMKLEGKYEGCSKLKKAELVKELADGIMKAVEEEEIRAEIIHEMAKKAQEKARTRMLKLKAKVMKAYSQVVRKGNYGTGRLILRFLQAGQIGFGCNAESAEAEDVLEKLGCAVQYSRSYVTARVYLRPSKKDEEA